MAVLLAGPAMNIVLAIALFYTVDVAPVDVLTPGGAGTVSAHRVEYVGSP